MEKTSQSWQATPTGCHAFLPVTVNAVTLIVAWIGIGVLAFLAPCGCGTITTRAKGTGGLYSGTGHDLENVGNAREWCDWSVEGQAGNVPFLLPRGLLWVFDTPLSFAADTLLAPVDALRSPETNPDELHEAWQQGAADTNQPIRWNSKTTDGR